MQRPASRMHTGIAITKMPSPVLNSPAVNVLTVTPDCLAGMLTLALREASPESTLTKASPLTQVFPISLKDEYSRKFAGKKHYLAFAFICTVNYRNGIIERAVDIRIYFFIEGLAVKIHSEP